MSLKGLFQLFSKDDDEKELKKKITALEIDIIKLKQSIASIHEEKKEETVPAQKEPPIIIEKINIEKIVLDKYELNNNFGQVGIKELKGKLNIGATYGSEFIPKPVEEREKKPMVSERVRKPTAGPKVNIQSKKED